MLFDLRARGRRRTVQGVYLGLAILIGGGLILFGVGTGTGGGGLLNGIGGSGSGNNQNQAGNQEVKTALKQANADPQNAAAWSGLIQARWLAAGQGTDFSTSTGTFTAAGKQQLAALTADWQHYSQLTKSPDPGVATLVARVYGILGQYGNAANTWEAVTLGSGTDVPAYECLAVTAYAAGQARKGDLATAKVVSLLPTASRTTIKPELKAARSSTSTAQQLAANNCEAA